MANRNFENIFKHFKSSFEAQFNYAEELFISDEEGKKYVHNYEFGAYRESLVREFLKTIIPSKLEIGQGFLINRNNATSKQLDLIIYDHNNSPLIEDQLNNRFFPVESVVGIGEVKSVINSKPQLKDILKTLAKNKKINRDKNPEYVVHREDKEKDSNYKKVMDKPFSFLLCKKLNFKLDNIENEIEELYDGLDIKLWHNLIFSIEDGYIGYEHQENKGDIEWVPVNNTGRNKCLFRTPGESKIAHFRSFAKAINILSFATSIYRPHLPDYITIDNTAELRIEK